MSNLAQTQATWNRIFREFGFYLGVLKQLEDVERKFDASRSRTQIVEHNNINGITSAWTLTGVVFGTNTDENGTLFVREAHNTPSAGKVQISLYRAAGAGGSDLMAQGNVTTPGTITLAAQNSSGLSGTVVVTNSSVDETDDKHVLLTFPDYLLRSLTVFDGTAVEHAGLKVDFAATAARLQASISSCQGLVLASLNKWLAGRLATFLGSSQSQPISATTSSDAGLITTSFVGFLEDLRADMVDEATAGAQTVVKNVVTSSAPVADSHNQGLGSLSTPTMTGWATGGPITLVCTSPTIGTEQFSVSQRVTAANGTVQVFTSEKPLTIKRTFASPILGISAMLLSRTYSFPAGSSTDFSTTSSDWSIAGESASNTSAGQIYLQVQVNPSSGSQFALLGFKTAARTAGTQVFQTDYGVANAVVNINPIGGSGLTGSTKIGSAPTDGHTGTVNLNPFVTQNSVNVPDKFTIAVAETSSGEFSRRIREFFDYAVNGAASGAQSIAEGYVSAGTFPPYSVLDA